MLKRIVFFLSLALFSNVLWGDEFKVRILSCPKEVVVSAPVAITAEVTNVSGRVITVAYGHGGFTVSLGIRRSDGKPLPPYAGPVAQWMDNFQMESIPVDWKQVKILDAVPLPVESCELVVQAVLASHGPYFHYDKGEKLPVEAWSGEVKSEEARIQIVEPNGVDQEAYNYFKRSPLSKPQDLLAKFPASTYAGYFLGLGAGFPMIMDSKPEYVVKTLWRENYLQNHPLASVTREVTKDGKNCQVMGSEPMRGYLQAQRSKIESYLALHPDHARREIMELARAYQSLALGDKDTALRSLEWVSCNAPAQKWREQGLAVLDVLKAEK